METERDEMQKWVVIQAAVKVELQEMRDCEERSAKIAKVGEGSAALSGRLHLVIGEHGRAPRVLRISAANTCP